MKKMLKLILAMTLMISSFATGVFAEENESEKSSSVSVSIRKADVQLDADLIGELPFTEGLVVEANAPIFVPENSKQVVERVEIQFTDEEGNMNSFYLPDRRYESTDSKILLRKENYAYINPILAGRYVVTVLVHMLDVTSPPPKPFVNAYQTEGVFEFEGTHKNVPTTSYVNVEEQGVRVGCDLSEAGCKEWLQALHYNSLNTSYLEISASGGSFTIPKQDSETPEYKSSEVFPYQDGDSEILVPALIITSVPIELGSKYEFSVHADGYFSRSKEVDSPFGSAPLDASKIEIVQIEKGADGEPALVISVPNSEEYRQWIYSINTLEFPDMGQCGIEDFTYSETEEKISYELPYHLSGGFGKTDENGITLGVMAPGYSTMYVNNVVLRYAYEQAPITDFSVAVKGSGIEISAMGPGGRAWLEALTVFKENLQYRPYIRMYANNMGNVTMIRLSNANANDDVLSKNNLTPESTEGTDENTVHTLFISAKSILKSGTMGAGNTVVNVMPNPYGYSQNPMLSNVSLYPMMKLVSETQNSVENNTNIDTEVLDELDGYLKNNQISNVTVLVNEEDLRHNGNSKVELKGELTAMIVSDENGNYSVKDLDYDSVSMNMSTTIDDVKLTDEQIQEYVEILAETTTQMQTVYDNFGFDIKLHKEEKEMKDLAVATAISFELPEAIEVKDGDTLVLLTVHNGSAKYLPVVIMTDDNGNRTGLAYTSEFSSFVPVVLSEEKPADANHVPSDAEVVYDTQLGLVISSKDTEWLKGIQGYNMSSEISWNGGNIGVGGPSFTEQNSVLVLEHQYIKGQYQLKNGVYSIIVQSENYYNGEFTFEINESVAEASIAYADDMLTVTTDNSEYINALSTSGQMYFMNEYTHEIGSSSLSYHSSEGNKHYFSVDFNSILEDGSYMYSVYTVGYQVIGAKFTISSDDQDEAIIKLEVTSDGSIKLIPNTIDYATMKSELLTVGTSERARLSFVNVDDPSVGFNHWKPMNGGAPSGMPYYQANDNGQYILIPVDQLVTHPAGEYHVTYMIKGQSYPLGTITLAHQADKDDPAYTYSYDLKKEVLTIECDDLDFLNSVDYLMLTRGAHVYVVNDVTVDKNHNSITVSREELGALVSSQGNGTDGGEKFFAGSYSLAIWADGYKNDSASNFVDIYPAVVKNNKPVKDNKHGVHGKDHVCDYLHGHMVTYVEEVFEENYKNDGSSSETADNAVRNTLVSSDISAEVVVTDNVNAANSALIANEMTGYTVVSEFEMEVLVTIDGVVQEGATINELDAALEYEMMIPENLPEVAEGYERQYNVVRVHEEDVDVLETTISENNMLEFESDLYSTYALVYRDVKKSSDEKEGVVDGYLYINGVKQLAYQLVNYQGDYYFVNDYHKLAMNTTLYLSERFVAGKTYSDGTALEVGYYSFDAAGKMVIHNGPVGDYFYVNNIQQKAYQLVEYAGNYYFINDYHRLAKNVKLYLGERFVTGKTYADGTPIEPGYFEFDETGKMIIKNGPLGDYFYVNNIQQKAYQLVEYAGNYYFINDYHKLAKATKLYLSEKFVSGKTYADGTVMQPGYFEFDETGKMVIHNGPAGEYFYVNNVMQKAYQLVEYEGHYYFINDCHKLAKSMKLYLGERFVTGKTYADGTPIEPGYFEFDETGKMIIKNGPVDDYFYVNNIQQKAYQLVEYGGNYYFINDAHKLAKNKKLYLSERFVTGKTYADGTPISAGLYEFDSEGKMITN